MGVGVFFQMPSDVHNKLSHLWRNLMGMGFRSSGLIPIPIHISRVISMKPFKKPFLGSSHFLINRNRIFVLQILFDSHLSQSFFFHWVTSWVGVIAYIIKQFQPKSNRCTDIKTEIKGNLCSDTYGLPMF